MCSAVGMPKRRGRRWNEGGSIFWAWIFCLLFFSRKKVNRVIGQTALIYAKSPETNFEIHVQKSDFYQVYFFSRWLKTLLLKTRRKKIDLSKFAFSGDIFQNIIFQIAIYYSLSNPLKHSSSNLKRNKFGIKISPLFRQGQQLSAWKELFCVYFAAGIAITRYRQDGCIVVWETVF